MFNFVTECFKTLAEEYKSRSQNKTFIELKQQFKNSNNYDDEKQPAPIVGNNFNDKFNKTFDMCKLEDEELDFGYGDIMSESSKIREDFSQLNLFDNKKFDTQTFNNIFISSSSFFIPTFCERISKCSERIAIKFILSL